MALLALDCARRGELARDMMTLALPLTLVLAMPRNAAAQQPQGAPAAAAAFDARAVAEIRAHYLADLDTLHSKFMQLANAIPAEKYSWRPGQGVRSISEVFMHVAGEWYHWAPMSVAGRDPAGFPTDRAQTMAKLQNLEKTAGKTEVLAELNRSWAHCRAQIQGADPAQLTGKYKPWGVTIDEAAFGMAGDLHEHLGQLIAYSRSVGVKPPWSK